MQIPLCEWGPRVHAAQVFGGADRKGPENAQGIHRPQRECRMDLDCIWNAHGTKWNANGMQMGCRGCNGNCRGRRGIADTAKGFYRLKRDCRGCRGFVEAAKDL